MKTWSSSVCVYIYIYMLLPLECFGQWYLEGSGVSPVREVVAPWLSGGWAQFSGAALSPSPGADWRGDRRGPPGLGHGETLQGQTQLLAPSCVPALLAGGVGRVLGHPCPPPAPRSAWFACSGGRVPGQPASPAVGKQQSRGANCGTNFVGEAGVKNNSKK